MKTLTLVSAGAQRPDPETLRQLEESDQYPRVTLFQRVLNSDLLDERFLDRTVAFRRRVYNRLPISAAQITEAYILRKDYNAVISWAEHLGLPFATLLKMTGSRVPHVAIFSWISKRKKAQILKRVHSHIDKLILMSSYQRSFALNEIGIPESKIVALQWSVDSKFWRPVNHAPDMICGVGREMRDWHTLGSALRGLDIKCHIASGTLRTASDPWLKSFMKSGTLTPNISVGRMTFSELRSLYARSRFVVIPLLPTDTDNGATSILEAMAMGKAVISTKTRGNRDVMSNGKTGILVPERDPAALREAILYLLNNPEVSEQMGKEGRTQIEKHHSLDQFVHEVRTAVEEVIEAHKRRKKTLTGRGE